MKRTRLVTILILSVTLVFMLSGCTTYDNFKAAFIDDPDSHNDTVRIGVYEALSGADKDAASREIEGIEIAYEMYPTVNGKMVELDYADNNSDIDAAETAVKTLIEKKPSVILGSYSSVLSLAAGDYIKDARIPAIAITNTNPLVTKNNSYYFRVCYPDANQGDVLAEYIIQDKKAEEAGVMTPEGDDAALAIATAFTDRFRTETENDDAVTAYENYKAGSTDFSRQLTKIQKTGVKYVILPGDMNDSANIINQAAEMKLDVQFMGIDSWGSEEFTRLLSDNVTSDDIAFVRFFSAEGAAESDRASQQKAAFLKAYRKAHGDEEPDAAVALGFDAYCLALNAIDVAPDDASPQEIRNTLAQAGYSFDGVSGQIRFSKIGDPIKTAYISTWSKGKIKTLYTVDHIQ